MHLFGDSSGLMAHFRARHETAASSLTGRCAMPTVRWRVLRSEQGFAASAEPPGLNGQALVNESTDTYLADQGLDPDKQYWYTVFSRSPTAPGASRSR